MPPGLALEGALEATAAALPCTDPDAQGPWHEQLQLAQPRPRPSSSSGASSCSAAAQSLHRRAPPAKRTAALDASACSGPADIVNSGYADASEVAQALVKVQTLPAKTLAAASTILADLPASLLPIVIAKSTIRRGKGGRQPAADPRLDPNIDPRRAKRILANRQSAARSKLKQKLLTESQRAKHQVLSAQQKPTCSEPQQQRKRTDAANQEHGSSCVQQTKKARATRPQTNPHAGGTTPAPSPLARTGAHPASEAAPAAAAAAAPAAPAAPAATGAAAAGAAAPWMAHLRAPGGCGAQAAARGAALAGGGCISSREEQVGTAARALASHGGYSSDGSRGGGGGSSSATGTEFGMSCYQQQPASHYEQQQQQQQQAAACYEQQLQQQQAAACYEQQLQQRQAAACYEQQLQQQQLPAQGPQQQQLMMMMPSSSAAAAAAHAAAFWPTVAAAAAQYGMSAAPGASCFGAVFLEQLQAQLRLQQQQYVQQQQQQGVQESLGCAVQREVQQVLMRQQLQEAPCYAAAPMLQATGSGTPAHQIWRSSSSGSSSGSFPASTIAPPPAPASVAEQRCGPPATLPPPPLQALPPSDDADDAGACCDGALQQLLRALPLVRQSVSGGCEDDGDDGDELELPPNEFGAPDGFGDDEFGDCGGGVMMGLGGGMDDGRGCVIGAAGGSSDDYAMWA